MMIIKESSSRFQNRLILELEERRIVKLSMLEPGHMNSTTMSTRASFFLNCLGNHVE